MAYETEGSALVLVGMSVREVKSRARLREMAQEHGGTVAFLQVGDPSLSRELTRLADAGVDRIVLVGLSLGTFAPAVSWLRRIAAHWWRHHGDGPPEIAVAPRLLGDEHGSGIEELVVAARPVTGSEPGLTSAAWEEVTRHRHQVMLCRGPRCTARGSDVSAEAMLLALVEAGLSDDDVLLVHTGCQLPCNQAPVVSVQPDDVWYGGVDPESARRIVAEHLVGGAPVATHRLPRERRRPLG